MENKLKPCPFCGGKAASHLLEEGTIEVGQLEQNTVFCIECDASVCRAGQGDDAAEILWNTRPQ